MLYVLEHAEPNPAKLAHTVFAGGPTRILGLIDEAWLTRGPSGAGDPGAFFVPMGRAVGTAGDTGIRIIVVPNTPSIIPACPVFP